MTNFILGIYKGITKCTNVIFHNVIFPFLIIFLTTSNVSLISLSSCIEEINPASYLEGAKYIPFFIQALINVENAWSFVLDTSLIFDGSFSEKKNPNMPQ